MRKLIVSNLISLDGLFEGLNNDLSWFKIDPEFHKHMTMIYDRCDTILLGRKTYDLFVDYWPDKTREFDTAADFINQSAKIVFSNTLKAAPWGRWKEAILFKGDLVKQISELKRLPGKDIIVFGSGSLVSVLTQAGLIDEYRFVVNNVILGEGNSMFRDVTARFSLTLKSATVLNFGIVVLDYERASEA